MTEPSPSAEVVLARYAAVPAELEQATAGLTESQLDLAREPESWTIRQLVHHIVDGDDVTKTIVKAALGNDGCRYELEWYTTDNRWAQTLDYAGRGVAPTIDLLRANHRHIEQIIDRLPESVHCTVRLRRQGATEDTELSVAALLGGQTEHARYHIAQVRKTREVHGLQSESLNARRKVEEMSKQESTFGGFPAEALQFLNGLAANNNREWFEANKATYKDVLIPAAQGFVIDLGERMQDLSPGIRYDTRLTGSGSIMRIYRDVRFSPDKTPYRPFLGVYVWEGAGKKMENPGFFTRITGEGAELYSGKHSFQPPMLAAFRGAVADERGGRKLERAIDSARKNGAIKVGGEHYKRVPRGYDPEHPRADLLRYNALFAELGTIDSDVVMSDRLVNACVERFRGVSDLHHWLVGVRKAAGS